MQALKNSGGTGQEAGAGYLDYSPKDKPPEPRICTRCGRPVPPRWLDLGGGTRSFWCRDVIHDSCREELLAEERQEQEAAAAKAGPAGWDSMIPPGLAAWDFGLAQAGAAELKSGEDLQAWKTAKDRLLSLDRSGTRQSAYLHGPPGSGKSVLAACLMAGRLARGKPALWLAMRDIIPALRKKPKPGDAVARLLARARDAELLVLDGLGVPEITRKSQRAALVDLIGHRLDHHTLMSPRLTCVTTPFATPVFRGDVTGLASLITRATLGIELRCRPFGGGAA